MQKCPNIQHLNIALFIEEIQIHFFHILIIILNYYVKNKLLYFEYVFNNYIKILNFIYTILYLYIYLLHSCTSCYYITSKVCKRSNNSYKQKFLKTKIFTRKCN